ncbi:vacuolar ATPase assembly integral membrane protein VMA21 [Microdochium nivale]|nr:vacuolar ATPase assembly integral membrane protein VMA21 [Microdochium nivale]
MATRRIATTEKTAIDRDEFTSSSSGTSTQKSIIAPAVPTHVILKLLAATFAMVVLPIGSYFVTLHTLFKGNASYAGGFAAIMANVVLVGYIIVAMKEDQTEQLEAKKDR